jgi:hypothetical protein
MGPFGSGYRAFDSDMVDLSIIVSSLSLGVKLIIIAFRDCEDCAVGGEDVGLLWRWWWWVVFCLDLRVGVGWHWICDLWDYQGVCYLWSWRMLRMICCGIMVRLVICRSLGLAIVVSLWEKAKGRLESTDYGAVANASCDLLLRMMIVAKTD